MKTPSPPGLSTRETRGSSDRWRRCRTPFPPTRSNVRSSNAGVSAFIWRTRPCRQPLRGIGASQLRSHARDIDAGHVGTQLCEEVRVIPRNAALFELRAPLTACDGKVVRYKDFARNAEEFTLRRPAVPHVNSGLRTVRLLRPSKRTRSLGRTGRRRKLIRLGSLGWADRTRSPPLGRHLVAGR